MFTLLFTNANHYKKKTIRNAYDPILWVDLSYKRIQVFRKFNEIRRGRVRERERVIRQRVYRAKSSSFRRQNVIRLEKTRIPNDTRPKCIDVCAWFMYLTVVCQCLKIFPCLTAFVKAMITWTRKHALSYSIVEYSLCRTLDENERVGCCTSVGHVTKHEKTRAKWKKKTLGQSNFEN